MAGCIITSQLMVNIIYSTKMGYVLLAKESMLKMKSTITLMVYLHKVYMNTMVQNVSLLMGT